MGSQLRPSAALSGWATLGKSLCISEPVFSSGSEDYNNPHFIYSYYIYAYIHTHIFILYLLLVLFLWRTKLTQGVRKSHVGCVRHEILVERWSEQGDVISRE